MVKWRSPVQSWLSALILLEEGMNKSELRVIKSFLSSGMAAFGGMAGVAGEIDDAPGLIFIGMAIILWSVYINVKNK